MKQGYFLFLTLLIGLSGLQEQIRRRLSRTSLNAETDGLLLLYANAFFLQLSFFLITGIVFGDLWGMFKELTGFLAVNALTAAGIALVCRYFRDDEEEPVIPEIMKKAFSAQTALRILAEDSREILQILPCGKEDLYQLKGSLTEDHPALFLKVDREQERLLLYEGSRLITVIRFDSAEGGNDVL